MTSFVVRCKCSSLEDLQKAVRELCDQGRGTEPVTVGMLFDLIRTSRGVPIPLERRTRK